MATSVRTIELINNLVNTRYAAPGLFSEFAENLKKLGLTYFHYDVMADELRFYAGDIMAHTIKRDDIKEIRSHLSPSASFDISALEKAIELFDSGKTSAVKFHEDVFAAGVILCSVFLSHHRIIYLGVDGDTYHEDY